VSVWLTIPSARPPEQANPVLQQWRERGYKIALWLDGPKLNTGQPYSTCNIFPNGGSVGIVGVECDLVIYGVPYPGYAVAVNTLVKRVIQSDRAAEWFIAAGDDTLPDPNHTAEEIATECGRHFDTAPIPNPFSESRTYGVMQPTGDRFGSNPHYHPIHDRGDGIACGCGYLKAHPVHTGGAYIDCVAGSAWYGREYCRRMYGGRGPLWPEYRHMFVDTEARDVAIKMGVYWERRDLTQHHEHWSRKQPGAVIPEFLLEASSRAHWDKYKAIYEARKAAGFPGSEPEVEEASK